MAVNVTLRSVLLLLSASSYYCSLLFYCPKLYLKIYDYIAFIIFLSFCGVSALGANNRNSSRDSMAAL